MPPSFMFSLTCLIWAGVSLTVPQSPQTLPTAFCSIALITPGKLPLPQESKLSEGRHFLLLYPQGPLLVELQNISKEIFIFFLFGCGGKSQVRHPGSFVATHGLLSSCDSGGLSSWGGWVSLPQRMWDLSFLTRDGTHVHCLGSWILNHWTTREVSQKIFMESMYSFLALGSVCSLWASINMQLCSAYCPILRRAVFCISEITICVKNKDLIGGGYHHKSWK